MSASATKTCGPFRAGPYHRIASHTDSQSLCRLGSLSGEIVNEGVANNVIRRATLNPVLLIDVGDESLGETELDGCLVANGSSHDKSSLSNFKCECSVLEDYASGNPCGNKFTAPLASRQHVV